MEESLSIKNNHFINVSFIYLLSNQVLPLGLMGFHHLGLYPHLTYSWYPSCLFFSFSLWGPSCPSPSYSFLYSVSCYLWKFSQSNAIHYIIRSCTITNERVFITDCIWNWPFSDWSILITLTTIVISLSVL